MVYAAKEAGVKAVKLQTINPDKSYAKDTESYKIFSKAKLTSSETEEIFSISKKLNLDIFTTVADIETAEWIKSLKPAAWKISSSLFTHLPLINHIASFEERIFLSTGLVNYEEIDHVIKVLRSKKKKNFSLLHCVSKYPTAAEEVNLCRMETLKNKYNVEIGYSDHTNGMLASYIAVAKGAKVIEKHFTNDNKRKGYDHKISLNYKEMKRMVEGIMLTEKMLSKEVNFLKVINNNRNQFLRVIVANDKIYKGEVFNKKNLSIKRVINNRDGVAPNLLEKLLGKKSIKNYYKDQIIRKIELKND
jgi:sialic acid synthase SpsE